MEFSPYSLPTTGPEVGTYIPNVGRFGVIADPEGAVLALFTGTGTKC